MADSPFETAAKATLTALYAQFGKAYTVTRGANATTGVSMLPPSAGTQVVTADGVRARAHSSEFIVKKADYKISSVAVEPARGDTITDASSKVYDVTEWESLEDTAEWRITASEVD